MLDHRLRRWPNIKTTLGQRLVSAGQLYKLQPIDLVEEDGLHYNMGFYITRN